MLQQNKKSDKSQPKTFVDGVPVKISEQYKPPRRIVLPVSCQNCTPGEALYQEYDFKLEHSVIDKLAEWKKMRKEDLERRKERVKKEEKARDEINRFGNLTLNQVDKEEVVDRPTTQLLNPKLTDSILTPVCAKQNSPSQKPASSLFDLSDFESDNSSPFDNMELKTINDMEVLASILTTDNAKNSLNNNNRIIDKELGKNGLVLNNKNGEWGNGHDNFAYSNTGYNLQNNKDLDRYGHSYPVSANFQIYNNYGLDEFSNELGAAVSTDRPATSVNKLGDQILGSNAETKSRSILYSQKTKSVPDIVEELEKELKENRKRDEEMEKKTKASLQSNNSKKSHKSLSESSGSPSKGTKTESGLPDPTSALSPTVQTLAKHISEMGFPLSRVSRAFQTFGEDDKKVIEFLLQVQSIEEKDYPGDYVEKALQINNLDADKTIKYLDAMLVLLDLGFEEEKVEKALIQTNSDRDKALDLLIS